MLCILSEGYLLTIPKIGYQYIVNRGTTNDILREGIGMVVSDETTEPDKFGHTVLSGHRDGIFRPLKELEVGDILYLTYYGVDYEYNIESIWVTYEGDLTVIVPKEETLTLTTCYLKNVGRLLKS